MNVLLVAVWMRRGHTYLALQARDALVAAGHGVHVFARSGHIDGTPVLDDRDELHLDPEQSTRWPAYRVDAASFDAMLRRHRFDVVVFVEEQWQPEPAAVTARLGIPSVNIVMWEFFHPHDPHYANFNVLLFPSQAAAARAERYGYRPVHVPWGVDMALWLPSAREHHSDEQVRFVHCSGWGGGYSRKQTQFVIDAFRQVRNRRARLLVHRQTLEPIDVRERVSSQIEVRTANLARPAVAELYRRSDCALAPSKWEGLGFSLLEPLAAGIPVVTLDTPPMNEIVEHRKSGMLTNVERYERYDGIAVPAAVPDEADFVHCMETLADDPGLIANMARHAHERARQDYDWAVNGPRFVLEVERAAWEKPAGGARMSRRIARILTPEAGARPR